MSNKQRFFLYDDRIKSNCLRTVQSVAPSRDKPMVVEIREATRNDMQNKKLHAMLGDISRQATYQDMHLTLEQWKLLMISAHTIATGGQVDLITGIEGETCNIRELSSKMSVRRCASLIEYIQAWGAGNGIRFTESDTGGFYG